MLKIFTRMMYAFLAIWIGIALAYENTPKGDPSIKSEPMFLFEKPKNKEK